MLTQPWVCPWLYPSVTKEEQSTCISWTTSKMLSLSQFPLHLPMILQKSYFIFILNSLDCIRSTKFKCLKKIILTSQVCFSENLKNKGSVHLNQGSRVVYSIPFNLLKACILWKKAAAFEKDFFNTRAIFFLKG